MSSSPAPPSMWTRRSESSHQSGSNGVRTGQRTCGILSRSGPATCERSFAMANKAIMRTAKVKTMGQVAGLGKHIERERETLNADQELTDLNERLAGSGD